MVIDVVNEFIIGVSVVEKGIINGVIIDFDGNFVLSVFFKVIIIIFYVGYVI